MKPSLVPSWLPALGGAAVLIIALEARAEELPRMDPGAPVQCFVDADGTPWRVQCLGERCILAIDGELDAGGARVRPLERTRYCTAVDGFDAAAALERGQQVVRGVADAPRGWMRDERGRVFQVTFDLRRRLYAGVSWAPILRRADGEAAPGGAALDLGLLELEGRTGDASSGYRHRLRLVEGIIGLAPFGADLTVLRYDVSRWRADPLFRITTFFGTPRRYDIDAHLGGWFELGNVRVGEVAPGRTEALYRMATAHLTWDVWRTASMESFVRLRGGLGAERAREDGELDRDALTWAGAAEGDFTLGDRGFGRLVFLAQLERPTYIDPAAGPPGARRGLTRLGYERIILAVNDQPVTVRVAGEAEYRSDVPGAAPGWDLRALAGLRISLWAPAR